MKTIEGQMVITESHLKAALENKSGRESLIRLAQFEGLTDFIICDNLSNIELVNLLVLFLENNFGTGMYAKIKQEKEQEFEKIFDKMFEGEVS